jgi:hypothetical protein
MGLWPAKSHESLPGLHGTASALARWILTVFALNLAFDGAVTYRFAQRAAL